MPGSAASLLRKLHTGPSGRVCFAHDLGGAEAPVGLFLYRLMGAATLDAAMYEGIEADRRVTWQAAAAVVLSSVAAGIGAGGWYGRRLSTFVAVSVVALVTWLAWAVLMHQIGTRVLPGRETHVGLGELLRTTGFAAAPGLLQVFATLPRMVIPIFVVTIVWMFVAMVVGVRHCLDYDSNGRAVAVCGIAALLAFGLAIVFGIFFGPTVS
jgi:Yip1 domain